MSRQRQPPITRTLTVKGAAAYLSVSVWKIRALIYQAELPFIQLEPYGPFLIDIRDLDDFVERNKRRGT